jgi:Protein of unknown function (DUF3619)
MTENPSQRLARIAALESRLGLRVTDRLSEGAERLPHDVTERLRFARSLAVSRAPRLAPQVEVYGSGKGLVLGSSWWRPVASVLQVLALAGGLLLIGHVHSQAQISAAAEIDAALLSDDLPPEAYNDPGFVEFLKTSAN